MHENSQSSNLSKLLTLSRLSSLSLFHLVREDPSGKKMITKRGEKRKDERRKRVNKKKMGDDDERRDER